MVQKTATAQIEQRRTIAEAVEIINDKSKWQPAGGYDDGARVLASRYGKHTDVINNRSELILTVKEKAIAEAVVEIFKSNGVMPAIKEMGSIGLAYINVSDEELKTVRNALAQTRGK